MKLPEFKPLQTFFKSIWKPLKRIDVNRANDIRGLQIQNPVKSVGMKLFIIFFLCIVALVLVVGLFTFSQSKSIIEDKIADETKQTIMLVADKLETSLKLYEDLSMQILTDQEFMRTLQSYNDPNLGSYDKLTLHKAITDKLTSYSTGKNDLNTISLLPIAGGKGISNGSSIKNENPQQEEWFQQILKADGAAVWLATKPKGYYGATEPAFAMGRVLKNTNSGSKEFVLLLEIKVNLMNESLKKLSIGDQPILVIDNGSKLVRAAKNEQIGEPFVVTLDPQSIEDSLDEPGSLSENGMLTLYKKMKISGWTVAAAAPIAELVKETAEIRNVTIFMVIVAMLVAMVAGYIVVRMIGHPLIKLRNLMQEGALGNLTVRTDIDRRQDEIGELGRSFNQMMSQITKLVEQTTHSAAEVLRTSSELLSASKQTANSAREIAVATEEIANGASSLAIEAEKGNGLTFEIGKQVQQVIQANQEMAQAAYEVEKVSDQGAAYMSELINKTNTTEQMTRSMVEKVNRLKESTSSIKKILDVLNNMTKQTNILSLNATIEAARAGAAGRGFMVVADEIRKLAEQSKQSIDVVGQITETIQKEIDETVNVMSDAYPVFKEQIVSVKEADLIFTQVKKQMGGLSERLNTVTRSVQHLEESQNALTEAMSSVSAVSEESSATSEEVASLSNEQLNVSEGLVKLSESLAALSGMLEEALSRFKI